MASTAAQKAYHRQWYLKNREKRIAQTRTYQKSHKGDYARLSKAWRQKNAEKVQDIQARSRKKHAAQCRARCREWYSNKGRSADYLEKKRIYRQRRYAEQRDVLLARNKAWRQRNKPYIRARGIQRRALMRSATANLKNIQEWVTSVKSKRFATCYYCDKPTPTSEIHFDHIVPLVKGGAHSIENLCVACDHCNLSKGSKSVQAWIKVGQQMLAL